jgi:PEP-CTERM motif
MRPELWDPVACSVPKIHVFTLLQGEFMKLSSVSRKRVSFTSSILALGVALFLLTPGKLHATPITYDLTLTDASNSTYSGTGIVTFNTTPTATYTDYSADVTALSFTVDGETFSLSDPGASLTAFEFSELSPGTAIWDITFADQIGGGTSRLALHSTSGYVFYYNDELSTADGVFGAATVASSATPEPSSLFLLGTGLLGLGVLVRRQLAA